MTNPPGPDERALGEHLQSARFQAGVSAGRWRMLEPLDWPIAFIEISAAPRENGPSAFTFRFDLAGYPNAGPTGGPWDMLRKTYAETARTPKGARASQIFRGGPAMYAAWDRVTLGSHPNWPRSNLMTAWHSGRDLTFVLANVHEVLNADDYVGV